MSWHLLHKIEVLCVMLATSVASGAFGHVNERLTEKIGYPIDKIGVYADLGAGALALVHYLKSRGGHAEAH